MSNILVISGHPDLGQSVANRTIMADLERHFGNSGRVVFRYLDKIAPNYRFDIEAEQNALRQADVVVLQFPFQWYSVPALLKKWIDDVLTHGFAYGSTGTALHGKKLLFSFTAGGKEAEYGTEYAAMDAYLPAFQNLAHFTGMDFLEPVYSFGNLYVEGIFEKSDVENIAHNHAKRLIERLEQL